MFGVVLWRDAKDGKAVFWCEDQGDLAYFENAELPLGADAQFDAGDMVQFDVFVEQRLRRASNARLVLEQAYRGLPDQLRQNASNEPGSQENAAKVIPLQAYSRAMTTSHLRPKKRKA